MSNTSRSQLWSLKEQGKLARDILRSDPNAILLPIKLQLEALKAFLHLLMDAEKVSHMENILRENGLMEEVDKRSTLQFVSMEQYKKLEEQKKMYYQKLQKIGAEKNALQEKLFALLGVKWVPGDEKW